MAQTMRLEQTRTCDGACCRESPRWPDGAGSCQFSEPAGCRIKRGLDEIPAVSPVRSGAGVDVYNETCRDWPHNSPEGRSTGECCWQWVE